MLKTILAITGRPGLFKLLSRGNGTLIVEELGTGKRLPVHARDKVVSLGDILDKVYAAHEGKKIDVKALAAAKGLKEEFAKIVEDFDRDRVHDNDVKKLFTWYNILVDNGFTKFAEIEEEKEAEKSDAPAEEE